VVKNPSALFDATKINTPEKKNNVIKEKITVFSIITQSNMTTKQILQNQLQPVK
jgi:hypothetical protein